MTREKNIIVVLKKGSLIQYLWKSYTPCASELSMNVFTRPNKKIPVFRVTRPYLNLLVKLITCLQVFWKKIILCILLFPGKNVWLPYLKFSDPLPKTHLSFIWPKHNWTGKSWVRKTSYMGWYPMHGFVCRSSGCICVVCVFNFQPTLRSYSHGITA